MKPIQTSLGVLLSLAFLNASALAQISDDAARAISADYKSALGDEGPAGYDPRRVIETARKYKEFLSLKPETPLQSHLQKKGRESMLDFAMATAWSRVGDHDKALECLTEEVRSRTADGGIFLQNTRNPESFAMDVFRLHSEVMAHTGGQTLIPGAGYEVFEIPSTDGSKRFAFVFEPRYSEEGGVQVGNVGVDEERRIIQLTKPKTTGGYELASRAQVVARKGAFSIEMVRNGGGSEFKLGGITKFIDYIGQGVPVVRPSPRQDIVLRLNGDKIEQPMEVLATQSGESGTTQEPEGMRIPPKSSAFPKTGKDVSAGSPGTGTQGQITGVGSAWRWALGVTGMLILGALLWLSKFRGRP